MKTVVSLIAKIRTVKGPNEADKGVYNYFFDGEKYGVEEPVGGEGRRYAGPFTLRAQSVLIGNSLTTLFGFESAAPSGGELMYLNNPAFTGLNIGTENPYLAVVYHKDHLGSTRAVTKTDGTILEQNDYYPFGLRTTRGENYTTLSESLAAIAQSANNTAANTVAPEYLYNGKEKQDFIKNTSAVINAGGSTDYTSNYMDYGARLYNPTTIRWNTQDPMAEKYQRYSPYNYCVNNPISMVDPNGRDTTFFNLNGEVVKRNQSSDDVVSLLNTFSKKEKQVDRAYKRKEYAPIFNSEALESADNAYTTMETENIEVFFGVGKKETISKTVKGVNGHVPTEKVNEAINDIVLQGDTVDYTVHSHHPDIGNNTANSSSDDKKSKGTTEGKYSVVLGYDRTPYPNRQNEYRDIRTIGFYNSSSDVFNLNYDIYKSAVEIINKTLGR